MEFPSDEEVVRDVLKWLGPNATDAQIDEHILSMGRLTDEELAAFGVVPNWSAQSFPPEPDPA